jgi:hypothetical protein
VQNGTPVLANLGGVRSDIAVLTAIAVAAQRA